MTLVSRVLDGRNLMCDDEKHVNIESSMSWPSSAGTQPSQLYFPLLGLRFQSSSSLASIEPPMHVKEHRSPSMPLTSRENTIVASTAE